MKLVVSETPFTHPYISKTENVLLRQSLSVEMMKGIMSYYHPTNRPRNSSRLKAIERDIQGGNWQTNVGQFIRFDTKGHLIDGQKRMVAHINCNTPMIINVHFGLHPDAILFQDRNQSRSIANNVTIRRNIVKNLQPSQKEFSIDRQRFAVASWCKHGETWEANGNNGQKTIWTEADLTEYVNQNAKIIDFALDNDGTKRPGILGALALFAAKNWKEATEFKNMVFGDDNIHVPSSVRTLREYLEKDSSGGSYPIYDYNAALKCINAFHNKTMVSSNDICNNDREEWEF